MKPLELTEWKWKNIMMYFITGLPKTKGGYNMIWVIVDRLTKSTHFFPCKIDTPISKFADMYIENIVRFHGVPLSIVSDRDSRFTSHFWNGLQKAFGTKTDLSTSFHLQTDRLLNVLAVSDMVLTKIPLSLNDRGWCLVTHRDPQLSEESKCFDYYLSCEPVTV